MRRHRDAIIAEFSQVNGDGITVDHALHFVGKFARVEDSFDHETSAYDEVWTHPQFEEENRRNNHLMSTLFFTVYELKAGHTPTEYRPAFKFVIGPIGNTTVFNIHTED